MDQNAMQGLVTATKFDKLYVKISLQKYINVVKIFTKRNEK